MRPVGSGGEVAAVDQDVGVGGEMLADPGERIRMDAGHAPRVEHGRAQGEGALGAVGEDVDRVDAAARGHRLGDLGDAVAGRVEHHHVRARRQSGDDLVRALDAAVDEVDRPSRRARH